MGLMFRCRRPIARLAAGAATAQIASHAERREAEQAAYPDETTSAARGAVLAQRPPYIAPPPASTAGEVDELSRLAQMHESGALTDDEFVAAKAQLLGL